MRGFSHRSCSPEDGAVIAKWFVVVSKVNFNYGVLSEQRAEGRAKSNDQCGGREESPLKLFFFSLL